MQGHKQKFSNGKHCIGNAKLLNVNVYVKLFATCVSLQVLMCIYLCIEKTYYTLFLFQCEPLLIHPRIPYCITW